MELFRKDKDFVTWVTSRLQKKQVILFYTILSEVDYYYRSQTYNRRSLVELTYGEADALYRDIKLSRNLKKRCPDLSQTIELCVFAYLCFISRQKYNEDDKARALSELTNCIERQCNTNSTTSYAAAKSWTQPTTSNRKITSEPRASRIYTEPKPQPRDYKIPNPLKEKKKAHYKLPIGKKRSHNIDRFAFRAFSLPNEGFNFDSYDWVFQEIANRAPSLKPFVDEVRVIPRPARGEIKSLIDSFLKGDSSALNQLVEIHLRLVLKTALKATIKYDLNLEETVCEANVQIIPIIRKAIEQDGSLSFVQLRLERGIYSTLSPGWCEFPILYNERERIRKIKEILDQSDTDTYSSASIPPEVYQQIRDRLGPVSKEHIESILESTCVQNVLHLDAYLSRATFAQHFHVSEWELQKFYDFSVPNENEYITIPFHHIRLVDNLSDGQDPYDKDTTQIDILKSTFSALSDREITILFLRYGMNGNQLHTLAEIGKHLNLTRERIRQLEAKAIRRMKWYLSRNQFYTKNGASPNLILEKRYKEIQDAIDKRKEELKHTNNRRTWIQWW